MIRILHFSDTHFGTEVPEVIAAFSAAVEECKPDLAILSGDITQRARPEQFAAAAAFMRQLPVREWMVVPGNHDIPLFHLPLRFFAPYKRYHAAFAMRNGLLNFRHVTVIGMDATHPMRHTRGRVQHDILRRLAALAQKQQPGLLIACIHQPLLTALAGDMHEALIERDDTARLLADMGVDLVLSGHVHSPLITTTQDAYPSLARPFILSGAGTAFSHRIRPHAPNSFHIIDAVTESEPAQLAITPYIFSPEQGAFLASPAHYFHRSKQGWQQAMQDQIIK